MKYIALSILVNCCTYVFGQFEFDSIMDSRDGKLYKTVLLGDSWWFAENLNYDIPDSWAYDDKEENSDKFGRLYTWDAAMNSCPSGWHLPSDEEWQKLEAFYDMPEEDLAHKNWRGESTSIAAHFHNFSTKLIKDSTFVSVFDALPAGYRKHAQIMGFIHKISFEKVDESTGFWTSTDAGSNAYYRFLQNDKIGIFRFKYFKKAGFSVRCVKTEQ